MWRQVLALSSLAVGVHAAAGNTTALCQTLIATCPSSFPAAGFVLADCVTLMDTAVTTAGDDTDTSGNTIGCRQYYANKAASMANMTYNCVFAGFTGGGLCGTPLDNTCSATLAICGAVTGGSAFMQYTDQTTCLANLGTTGNMGAVWGSIQGPNSAGEDSLECRVYHALAAYAGGTGAEFHCGHTHFPGNASFCGGVVTTNANHHCASILVNCNVSTPTPRQQYSDMAMCLASFATFPDGPVSNSSALNDRGCRQYHGNAGLAVGTQHCPHGGPSGGGVCGGATSSRASWMYMSGVASCSGMAQYAYLNFSVKAAFGMWNSSDLMTIVPAIGATGLAAYSTTANAAGDDDACRIYHLSVASTVPNPHCDHGGVLGGGACGTLPTVACRMFQTACGTTAFADTAACMTGVGALLAANKIGNATVIATTKDDLACRAYQAGVALTSKMMGAAAAPAVTAACNGVKTTGSTICNGMATAPTASSASTVVSSMGLLAIVLAL